MKSLLNLIKKLDIFFVFLFFSFIILPYCFVHEISLGDEIWNYQNIYKMHNGFMIYKDCNVIITPIFYILGNLLFKCFSPNMITFKLYNLILYSTLITCIYCLFKQLNLNSKKSILFSSIVFLVIQITILAGANYNILSLIFIIISLIFLLKSREKTSYLFLNGLFFYLIFFTKQNFGIYYFIGICLSELFLNKNFFISLKRLFIQIIPTIILSTISLFVMYKYGILYDFINYTILGINEFAQLNIKINFLGILCIMFLLLYYIFLIWVIKNNYITDNKLINNLKLLICVSIPIVLIIFPIFNLYHFLLAMLLPLIILLYIFDLLLFTPILNPKIYDKSCYFITIFIAIAFFIYSIFNYFELRNEKAHFEINHPYYNCYFSDKTISKINVITEYIKSNNNNNDDVIILSGEAALYMIPLRSKSWLF